MRLRGRVGGLRELNARLSAAADPAMFAPDLREAAQDIRKKAADNLAGSGLAASLTVSADGAGGYVIGTPLDAGWHREFGSLTQPASPWLAPAAEAARPGLLARIAGRLRATLRRAVPRG